MFSKSCIYAIKVMIYLALKRDSEFKYIGVSEISKAIDSPKHFTAKILKELKKANIIDSRPGPNGGFYLPKDQVVSLTEIIRVIDGNQLLDGCILGFKECSELHPCPAHNKLKMLRENLKNEFQTTFIEEMKEVVKNGNGFLKFE